MSRSVTRILMESDVLVPVTGAAATRPAEVHTQWTPGTEIRQGTTPIRSTWQDARGPLLTNGAIREYAFQGRYGESWQRTETRRREQLQLKLQDRKQRQRRKTLGQKYMAAMFAEYV